MAKKPNSTELAAQLSALLLRAGDLAIELADMGDTLNRAYEAEVDKPLEAARSLAALARNASQLSLQMIARHELQEQKAELQRLRTETQNLKGKDQ